MAKKENPPLERGQTFYGPDRTIDTADLGGVTLEGMEWEFEDLNYSDTGSKTLRSGRLVKCRLVRNASGSALLPRRAVIYQETAGNFGKRVDGMGNLTADMIAGIVDEWLPTAGVRANDLFWITVEGPTECLPDLAGAANNVFSIGDPIIALTAETSQSSTAANATTAGRIRPVAPAGVGLAALTATSTQTTDGTMASMIANMLGRALSARTTANTTLAVLINMRPLW